MSAFIPDNVIACMSVDGVVNVNSSSRNWRSFIHLNFEFVFELH